MITRYRIHSIYYVYYVKNKVIKLMPIYFRDEFQSDVEV
jgi:hypothetical protein